MKSWREELAAMGYRFQFITLAGWHALNLSMFELASAYRDDGMLGYSQLQQREFGQEAAGYRAAKHQSFVGNRLFRCRSNRNQCRRPFHRCHGGKHRDRAVHRAGQIRAAARASPKKLPAAIHERRRRERPPPPRRSTRRPSPNTFVRTTKSSAG